MHDRSTTNFTSQTSVILRLLTVLALLLPGLTQANRADHGATPYPIWSELTYFERSTLGDLHKARASDPDALLALYLVASGARTYDDFETAKGRIRQFVKDMHAQLVETDNQWLTGQLLNQRMHQVFFLRESREGAPNGYAIDQSRLMGIFETGEFNCISASLLYAVLVRHFGLDLQGVMLPSHAFIQLNLDDGRRIDVETTSPAGYDQVHDEAFYERNNNDWFASRGLQPATYADYLKRERIDPTLLGARNMLNQHTISSRMDEKDSSRLAEISAFIDPANTMAQEKRLYFYNREIHNLAVNQDWKTLKRLFDTTYENVMADSRRHAQVQGMQYALQMYLSGAMLTYAQLGETEQTLALMGELLSRGLTGAPAPDGKHDVEVRVTNAVSVLMSKLAERRQFDEGLLVLALVEGHLSDPKAWPDMVSWFYLRWAEYQWSQKNWEQVVAILAEYLGQNHGNASNTKHAREVVGSAYHNWVLELVDARDWEQAKTISNECRRQFSAEICGSAQKVLEEGLKTRKKTIH